MNTRFKTYFNYVGSISLKRTMSGIIHTVLNDQDYTPNGWFYSKPFQQLF